MKQTWREYGVIAVLLVVAIGGYLLLSRNQEDVLRYSLNLVGDQLIALVPEGPDRERVAAAVDSFKDRVQAREVPASQVEAFAANVFNLGSSGAPVHAEEAEMVLKMALDEAEVLPEPAMAGVTQPDQPEAVRARVAAAPSAEDLAKLGARLERMATFYVDVRDHVSSDTTHSLLRFYANDGLHVIIDEAAKNEFVGMEAAEKLQKGDLMAWKSRFAEAVAEQNHRHATEADRIEQLRFVIGDSLFSHNSAMTALASLRRLESRGVVASAEVESVAVSIETRIESFMRERVESPGTSVEVSTTTVARGNGS